MPRTNPAVFSFERFTSSVLEKMSRGRLLLLAKKFRPVTSGSSARISTTALAIVGRGRFLSSGGRAGPQRRRSGFFPLPDDTPASLGAAALGGVNL